MAVGFGSSDSKGSARARVGNYSGYDGNDNGHVNGNGGTVASHVEPKYGGTAADQRDMQEMGRVQELRVRLIMDYNMQCQVLTLA